MTITFKTTPNTSKFRENMSLKRVLYLKYSRTYLSASLFLFVTGIVVGYMLELYSTAFVILSISMLLFIYATYTACVEENISRLNVTVFLIVTIISMMLALTIDVVWKFQDPLIGLVPSWIVWMADFPFMITRCSRLYNMYIKQKRKIKML